MFNASAARSPVAMASTIEILDSKEYEGDLNGPIYGDA